MRTAARRALAYGLCGAALACAAIALADDASAQGCGPGFVSNPYTAQCLAPVITPVIQGVPCVPSNLGLCQSFVQNLPVLRPPSPAAG